MRTLNQLESRIRQRQARQTLLMALGAPASVLAMEAEVTHDLQRQCAQRQSRVQQCFQTAVSLN